MASLDYLFACILGWIWYDSPIKRWQAPTFCRKVYRIVTTQRYPWEEYSTFFFHRIKKKNMNDFGTRMFWLVNQIISISFHVQKCKSRIETLLFKHSLKKLKNTLQKVKKFVLLTFYYNFLKVKLDKKGFQ